MCVHVSRLCARWPQPSGASVPALLDAVEQQLQVHTATSPAHLAQLKAALQGDTAAAATATIEEQQQQQQQQQQPSFSSPPAVPAGRVAYEAQRVLQSLVSHCEATEAARSIGSGVPRWGHLYGALVYTDTVHAQAGQYLWLCEEHHKQVQQGNNRAAAGLTAETWSQLMS